MAGLQFVDWPDYAAILFRRTYADLAKPGALMDRAHDWLGGTAATWNEQRKSWRFPRGGTLSFGHLEIDKDKFDHQSAEYQFVGFDELTQFEESLYRYLFSRLRRGSQSELPIRMRGATNPGGRGHEWVRQRFLMEGNADRLFVPAMLDDNPHLDRAEYVRTLAELDPFTRKQLLEGDWFAKPPGSLFRQHWFEIVDTAPADARRARFWDLAATEPKAGSDPDWTAGVRLATKDGRYWIEDVQRVRTTPQGVEQLIKQTAARDGRSVDIWMEQEPGSAGVNTIDHYVRQVLPGFTFRGHRTTGSKELRASPVSSAAEAGNLLLAQGKWINSFLDEAVSFPGGAHDDQIDALSGAFAVLTRARAFRAEDVLAAQPNEAPDDDLFA